MNCEKKYFYLTCNFYPDYSKDFVHMHDDIYRNVATGELFRKRLLCDKGWGQETGYVSFPEPAFEQLIALVAYVPKSLRNNPFFLLSPKLHELYCICTYNASGAVSVIMQDHVDKLVEFLEQQIATGYFRDRQIRKRFRLFNFDEQMARKFGSKVGNAVGNKAYYTIFQEHPRWAEISEQVIKAVYRW